MSYSEQVIAAMKKAINSPMAKAQLHDLLFKDANSTFTQSSSAITGITAYDLKAPAISLIPVITPLRNTTPRVGGGTGTAVNWRAITAINPTGVRPGVTPGRRGGMMAITTKSLTVAYKGLGTEVQVDFEAEWAAEGFDDPRAIATLNGLRNLMIQEEGVILGGNSDQPLNGGAATPTPNLVDASTGGALLNTTAYFVMCAALSFDGFQYGTVASGVQGQITRVNVDGSSDTFGGGTGKMSAEATITTSGAGSNTHSITASLTAPILGAAGYAWFLSTTTGLERLVAITSAPTVVLTALPLGTNQLASSLGANDNSTNNTVFDGLIYIAATSGSGAYVQAISTTLTGDGFGGIVQIDAALKSMWDNFRVGPNKMWVNSQEDLYIGQKILTGGTSAAQRFVFAADPTKLAGGILVSTYKNKFSMNGAQTIDVMLHPNMPPGTILMTADTIPYPLSGVGNVFQIKTRKEYNQIDWPVVTRAWPSGVYVDEVLQHYAPFSMALLYDIRPG
jgi:hypothetical protein